MGTSVSSGASAGASAGELTFRGTGKCYRNQTKGDTHVVVVTKKNHETRQSKDENCQNSNYSVNVGF